MGHRAPPAGRLLSDRRRCSASGSHQRSSKTPRQPTPLDLSQFAITLISRLADGGSVRIISKRRLREFWESRKHDADAVKRNLSAWYKPAKHADWSNFAALKQTFGSADQVGNCVVFDVGNNRLRLIARINDRKGIVYVLQVMDHAEYDENCWVEDCGCYRPPPKQHAAKSLRNRPARQRRRRK